MAHEPYMTRTSTSDLGTLSAEAPYVMEDSRSTAEHNHKRQAGRFSGKQLGGALQMPFQKSGY